MDGEPLELTIPVGPEQYEDLMATVPQPEITTTHRLVIGPHHVPGNWVVVSGRGDSTGRREVTLIPLED